MSEYSFLFAIAGVLIVGVMSPGPTFFIVARNTLSQSKINGFMTALGTALGVALFAVLASLGVTTLLEQVPNAYFIFKLLGGLYLVYLAVQIWRASTQPLIDQVINKQSSSSVFKSFSTGLITQLSNPKTALVIAGVFAAFVPEAPPSHTIWLVSLLAFVIDFTWYALVVLVLSTQTSREVYENAKTGFDRVAALFLGIVGIKLITD